MIGSNTSVIEADVTGALSAATQALTDHINGTPDSATAGSTNVLKAEVTDAAELLADKEALVSEKEGLTAAEAALDAALAAFEELISDATDAETAVNAELAKVNTLQSDETYVLTSAFTGNTAATLPVGAIVVAGSDNGQTAPIIKVGADGATLEAVGTAADDVPGFADMLAAAQASYNLEMAEFAAKIEVNDAIASVLEIEKPSWNTPVIAADSNSNGDASVTAEGLYALKDGTGYTVKGDDGQYYTADLTNSAAIAWDADSTAIAANLIDAANKITDLPFGQVTGASTAYYSVSGNDVTLTAAFGTDAPLVQAVLDARAALEAAEKKVSDREALEADLAAAQEMADALQALNDAITEATSALTDEGFAVEVIDAANEAGTADSDVFLLGDTDAAIASFNVSGDDTLYVGTDFELVEIADGETISDNLGNVDSKEVFVVVDGGNTKLYFEDMAFAGNGSTDADTTVITLTGVTGNVSIDADGFLTIA